LKELEKVAPKSKGIGMLLEAPLRRDQLTFILDPILTPLIVLQAVKEVLQSLVDDDLVDSEKIGTSIYFWAFPSKALHTVGFISVLNIQKDDFP
jgi:hypothetical protein